MPDTHTYKRQPIKPRYMVCKRQLVQKKPGTPTPVYEPIILLGTFDEQDALGKLNEELTRLRGLRFTVVQDLSKPCRYEAFRLNATGEWVDYELYIAVMSF